MTAALRTQLMVEPEFWGFFDDEAKAFEEARDWCHAWLQEHSSSTLAGAVGWLKSKGFDHAAIQAGLILYVGD